VTSSVTLGRIAGIRVGVHWSWLVVFTLLVWSLSDGVFPSQYEGRSGATYLAMALAAAALFFVSLLAHELGHAVVARREGMAIDGITLWLFGGVARFRGMFPSAGAELRIALAGPAVSLVIGVVLVGLAATTDWPAPIEGVLAYVGTINLVLLAFNLLPALPLDGGRVLRATLWAVRGDFAWATRVAAGLGRVFSFGLIGLGLAMLIGWSDFGGAWLAFLGWFLLGAASAEARDLAVREALAGLRVLDLMIRDPVTVRPGLTLGAFMEDVVHRRRYTTYPVVEGDRAVGLLPFRRVAEVPRGEWDRRTVGESMLERDDVPVVAAGADLADVLGALAAPRVGRALVLDGDRLVGILSVTDVMRALEAPRARRRTA
jgi:Zn-dependent protease/CBS domain-containing protein